MFQPVLAKLPERCVVSDTNGSKSKFPEKRDTKAKCVPISQRRAQKILTTFNDSVSPDRPVRRVLPPNKRPQPPGGRTTAYRHSVSETQRGPGASRSLNKLTTSQSNSGQPAEDPRRASAPVSRRSGKTMFAGLGKKVTSLVRARMAFQTNRKKTGDDGQESNSMEQIHEMPKVPRFSSFLSAEAQYAMLMGYEDELHKELSLSNPEYSSMLRRNKTPMCRVSIMKRHLSKNRPVTKPGEGRDESNSDEDVTRWPEVDDDEEFWDDDTRGHRRSSSLRHTATNPPASMSTSNLRRSKTVPKMLPMDRRLQLSYRMESAMDILDTIRVRHGDAPISPRVRANKRVIAPIRDYNSWSNVWKKEFSPCERSQYSAKSRV